MCYHFMGNEPLFFSHKIVISRARKWRLVKTLRQMHRCTDAQMHRCTDAQMHHPLNYFRFIVP